MRKSVYVIFQAFYLLKYNYYIIGNVSNISAPISIINRYLALVAISFDMHFFKEKIVVK